MIKDLVYRALVPCPQGLTANERHGASRYKGSANIPLANPVDQRQISSDRVSLAMTGSRHRCQRLVGNLSADGFVSSWCHDFAVSHLSDLRAGLKNLLPADAVEFCNALASGLSPEGWWNRDSAPVPIFIGSSFLSKRKGLLKNKISFFKSLFFIEK